MAQAAATVLDIFAPILSNTVVLTAVLGSAALLITGKIFIGLRDSYGELKGMVKASASFLKNTKLGLFNNCKISNNEILSTQLFSICLFCCCWITRCIIIILTRREG